MIDNQSMDEQKQSPQTPKTATLGGISALWLAGMSTLAFVTVPSNAAQYTSAPGVYSPAIAATAPAPDVSLESPVRLRPAIATIESEPNPASDISLLPPPQTVDFIVRFNNDIPEIDACSKMYRENKAGAQRLFSDWAAAHDALEGVALKKVSYSGEMILVWETGIKRPLLTNEVQTKLAQIKALPSVLYADADSTAQVQGAR